MAMVQRRAGTAKEPHFRKTLREEFERRRTRNSSYSMRAFAKSLGLNSGSLSKILNGKQRLAPETARRVAGALNLAPRQAELFVASAELAIARGSMAQHFARKRLRALKTSYAALEKDAFQAIADWRHLVALELASLPRFRMTRETLSDAVGISLAQAGACIERLARLGLLDGVTGRATEKGLFTVTPDGIAPEAMRAFHRGLLERAMQALDHESRERRDFSALTLRFEMRRLPELREAIRRFENSIVSDFGSSDAADAVLCVAVPCFDLVNGALAGMEGSKRS